MGSAEVPANRQKIKNKKIKLDCLFKKLTLAQSLQDKVMSFGKVVLVIVHS